MAEPLKTVLLLALPASGKSEVRKYLANLAPEVFTGEFHMGPTVQLDDFPYVHLMRQTDEALRAMGQETIFFRSSDQPFQDPRDWGTLIELLNEDYGNLLEQGKRDVPNAASWLLDRIDAARTKVGAPAKLGGLDAATRAGLEKALEDESRQLLNDLEAEHTDTLVGKTLVIEFARGGADGSSMPLEPPFGYAYSLSKLRPELLENASILYIWVTPEESRRKNDARTDPNDPGSILHHGVPIAVMLGDYGCDDIEFLLEQSTRPGFVQLGAHGNTYDLPLARFDNRVDKTTFVREDKAKWAASDVEALHEELRKALEALHAARQ